MTDPVARGLRSILAAMQTAPSATNRPRAGFSLLEVMVVVAIVGALVAVAGPGLGQFLANQRVKSAARSVADSLQIARAEAIRTGDAHIVYLLGQPDPAGTLPGVPALVIDDGPVAGRNCQIDAGESRSTIPAERGVSWGVTLAGATPAPGDYLDADPSDGATFRDAAGNTVSWVLFRGDGVPLTFDAACTLAPIGSGGGAVYVTNGDRDYAVVLSPLGAVRVHAYDVGANAWTN